ncbi:hypothetical protein AWJ20_4915 [Sugiyamaella lignohabitans]|uniref:Uncharacterized protein n=1 Tax=Sugiyamaella lignohabitans TaxID=796027 RepID=A0A167EE84_9ASCO|nr:uncharacterized protein AWJ20_4915 [Sugiyamaella lignohabitans]ANB13962.1 hypothetical protein AWJ20_4915 [Sugiyamaella lignohabitans]
MDQDVMVPWVLQNKVNKKKNQLKEAAAEPETAPEPPKPEEPPVVWNRYYHLYKQGELEEDVVTAKGRVVESGYERDNWWAIISKE